MSSLMNIITMIVFIFLFKAAITLYDRFANYKDRKLNFTIDVKKESINKMSRLEFEGFCKWLFEGTGYYSNIELTPSSNDGGVDIILTNSNNEKIFVECKRYDKINNSTSDNKNLVIGRVICQKLTGAMVANNVKHGIIITTGDIHPNAIEYINSLKENTDLDITFLTMVNIVEMLENRIDNESYSINVII